MSKEHQPRPKPEDIFGFTKQEQLFDRVSHARLMALVSDETTTVHRVEETYNNYGSFLFVTLSKRDQDRRIFISFWGQGFHESRERWLLDEWFWYQASSSLYDADHQIPREQAIKQIEAHRASISADSARVTQSRRGEVFEMLADLTDEDGAWSEMQDLPWWLLGEDDGGGDV